MSRIEQAIRAAREELDAAKALDDSDGEKAGKVAAAEAKVSVLEAQKKAIQDEINDAVRERIPGAESGAAERERKRLADLYGVTVEELDDKLRESADKNRTAETEAKRLQREKDEADAAKSEAEKERDEARQTLRSRDIRDAAYDALEAANYRGKKSHAFGSLDLSKVEEKDGKFDATNAVEALKADEFPGFEEPLNPPPSIQHRHKKKDEKKRAYRPNYSVPGG